MHCELTHKQINFLANTLGNIIGKSEISWRLGIFQVAHEIIPAPLHEVTTIAKSMTQLEAGQNANQTARWVMNKEKHADEIIEIATQYFLAQRIKDGMENYEANLKALHQIIVYSMKCKQTTDIKNVEKLKELIHTLEHTYMGEKHQH